MPLTQTNPAFEIKISTDNPNGIFTNSQEIGLFAKVNNNTETKSRGQLTWVIETDEKKILRETNTEFRIDAGQNKLNHCPNMNITKAGFYRFRCIYRDEEKTYSHDTIIGYNPDSIHVTPTPEQDFDSFWIRALAQLKSIDPGYKIIPQPDKSNQKRDVYLIEMKSVGNLTVRGWLEAPKKEGIYPALLRLPGYGSAMWSLDEYDDMIIFSFNPREHGNSDKAPGRPQGLWIRGLDKKEDYYYRGAYLDSIRAMDYLASRHDVDTQQVAVWGGSQGGGLSFVTAAFDQRVRYCIADIPFLCDWNKYFKTTHWDEIDMWIAQKPETRNWVSLLKTLSYFDTMNLAEKINAEILMRVGLQDPVCPPATCFATYNQIKSEKSWLVYRDYGHSLEEHWQHGFDWLKRRFHPQ